MRFSIPLISSVTPVQIAFYSGSMFILQLASGTTLIFASCIFLYNISFCLAFNLLHGLSTINGICVFLLALRTVLISQIAKIYFWQAADSNLVTGEATAQVMMSGMLGLLGASVIFSFMSARISIPRIVLLPQSLKKFALLSFAVGLGCQIVGLYGSEMGEFLQAFVGLCSYGVALGSLGIAASTANSIIQSHGLRAMDKQTLSMIGLKFGIGMLQATKQGMFEPVMVFVVTCMAFSFRFSLRHVLLGIIGGGIGVFILVPLSDFGRGVFRQSSLAETIPAFIDFTQEYFSSFDKLEKLHATVNALAESEGEGTVRYFGRFSPTLERFSLISSADRLVKATLASGAEGLTRLFQMVPLLPRSVTGNQITSEDSLGNYFGHKAGIIGDSDNVTAISFGFFAEAFAFSSYLGTAIFSMVLFLLFFFSNELLGGGICNRIWSVFILVFLQHLIAEAGVGWMAFHLVRSVPFLLLLYFFISRLETFVSQLTTRRNPIARSLG